MHKTRWLLPFLACLSGCVNVPVVPEAKGKTPIDGLLFNCSKPHRIERDCGDYRGPRRKITLNGTEILIGGSADGKIVIVGGAHYIRDSAASALVINQPIVTYAANEAFRAVSDFLKVKGVKIVNVQPVGNKYTTYSYICELDADGYKWLLEYSSD